MDKRRFWIFPLALLLIFCGCEAETQKNGGAVTAPPIILSDTAELFSDRDFDDSYDSEDSTYIRFSGSGILCDSDAVIIDGSTVTITRKGTYVLSGELADGMVIVDTDKDSKVQLVLDGVSIHSETSAPLYIRQADKVFLTLHARTENALTSGESFLDIDDNSINGTVFSRDDLTINGNGKLTVLSPAGHGIVSKDELTITGGEFIIDAVSHGIDSKDNICIAGGVFQITAGKDGVHAENKDDSALGFVYIEGGSISVDAQGDGISASSRLQIRGGAYNIVCGGGYANAEEKPSADRGGFTHGPRGRRQQEQISETDDTSSKGLKAGGELILSGGTFTVDSADDAIHANANVLLEAGSYTIFSGDDAIHADEAVIISGGEIAVSESYEGVEAFSISLIGGNICINAKDDGLNAAGGSDGSGFGGWGGDKFHGSTVKGSIHISGGTIYVHAFGDGIDANGTLNITGGMVTVCGPTVGDTSVLDYDISGTISGGTFIGTGSRMMAQSFSSSENQGVIALNVGSQAAFSTVSVKDASGRVLLTRQPEEDFEILVFSSPELVKGEMYTVTVGTESAEFEAS